jgi:GH15 family glucan-1,4-alpha-glucosidase
MGLVGNCAYMAYIDDHATVRWLCWPQFDSSFVFGSLLDEERGGHFSIQPEESRYTTRQNYLENTNILATEFDDGHNRFRVTDFAPRFQQYERHYKPLMLVRKVEPLSGRPQIRVECRPVGDYGRLQPRVTKGSNHIRYLGLGEQMRLTTNIPLAYVSDERSFVLNETKYLILTYGTPLEAPLEYTAEDFLRKTSLYWQQWVKSSSIGNFYQEQLIRSALVLKIHQFEDTGAIIASGTTGLPEHPDSGRNWDYRYCWMRDSYYTLAAFHNIGHFEELESYFQYIENIIRNAGDHYQPLYAINGSSYIPESEIPLHGYLGNRPVRIGNDAYTHIQNDVYGQVLVSLLPLYIDKRFAGTLGSRSGYLVRDVLQRIKATMDEPDAGLWEFRNRKQYHTYTYLFHWAGSNAAMQYAKACHDPDLYEEGRRQRARARAYLENARIGESCVYGQAVDVPQMDASTLHLITMGYLPPGSQGAREHLSALEQNLRTESGLFYRYRHADDFGDPQSTFLICAYWYVEALAVVGRLEEAVQVFDQLLRYGNHLGLMSEDVDQRDGSQWGNFPQAYSHVGLVNAAFRIVRRLDRPEFMAD